MRPLFSLESALKTDSELYSRIVSDDLNVVNAQQQDSMPRGVSLFGISEPRTVRTFLEWILRKPQSWEVTYQFVVNHKNDKLETNCVEDIMRQEWIAVSERLPEDNGTFYLVCDMKTANYLPDRGIYEDGKWHVQGDKAFVVTHWMPLPEPPKVK